MYLLVPVVQIFPYFQTSVLEWPASFYIYQWTIQKNVCLPFIALTPVLYPIDCIYKEHLRKSAYVEIYFASDNWSAKWMQKANSNPENCYQA